jgi:predicted RNA-binding protein YlxR (DUF448 family)
MKSLKKQKTDTAPQQEKKIPMRRCVGCMQSKQKKELIRSVNADGKPLPDPTGKANGRGIYLCRDSKCLQLAMKKRAIQRGLKLSLSADETEKIAEELADYAK